MKWIIKHHRTRGVHVTPTCFVNGLEAGIVSSGWSAEQSMSISMHIAMSISVFMPMGSGWASSRADGLLSPA